MEDWKKNLWAAEKKTTGTNWKNTLWDETPDQPVTENKNIFQRVGDFFRDTGQGLQTGVNVLKTAVQQTPSNIEKSVGGIVQGFEEMPNPLFERVVQENKLQPTRPEFGEMGKKMVADASNRIAEIKASNQIKPGSPADFATSIIGGIIETAPAWAVSALTKNPSFALAQGGLSSFGQTYATNRESGASPEQSRKSAIGAGAIDTVANVLPVKILLEPGMNLGKKALSEALTNGGMELLGEVFKTAIDAGTVDPDMKLSEALWRVGASGLAGTITGGALGATTYPLTKQRGNIDVNAENRVVDQQPPVMSVQENVTENIPKNIPEPKFVPPNQTQVSDQNPPTELIKNRKTSAVIEPDPGDQTVNIPPVENKKFSTAADVGGYSEATKKTMPPSTNVRRGTVENEVTPDYKPPSKSAIELPEIVEISKSLSNGRVPHIKERLGDALGLFHSNSKGESAIDLRADIFTGARLAFEEWKPRTGESPVDAFSKFKQNAEAQFGGSGKELHFKKSYNKTTGKYEFTVNERDPSLAPKVLAHEIGHLADWLPDKSLDRGNILGRIASLRNYAEKFLGEKPGEPYGKLSAEEIKRLQRQAHQLALEEKRGQIADSDIKPEQVLGIWNDVSARTKNPELYDYISKLSGKEKALVLKDALKGMVKFKLNKDLANYTDWTAREKAIYSRLFKEELRKRQAFERWQVTNELKDLTQKWKPFDARIDKKYTSYRHSSKELYADAISVLFNDPDMLEKTAPTFYKAFFNYLERKPEVKAIYDEIQNRLTNPETVGKNRLAGVREMLREGNRVREMAVKRGMKDPKAIVDSLEKLFIDRDQGFLKQIRRGKKEGGNVAELAQKARFELEEIKYMASEANDYVQQLNKNVMKFLPESGLTVEDMGVYMLAKRASTERATLANPRGLDEEAAKRMLVDLKKELGDIKYKNLETAVESYRKIRESIIIPRVEQAGMYSPEMITQMKDSKNYAKFSVQHYLEDKFGGQGTARVYQQIGTLADIENPFVATVMQDLSMLRAAKMNEAKSAALDFLNSIDEAAPAEEIFSADVGGKIAKPPKDPDMRILSVLDDGTMKSYYVHKDIAESFERNPFEATKLAEFAQKLTRPMKEIMVSKNPIWMARNIIRDVKATVKNVPEIRVRDIPKLAKYYNQAFKEVWQEAMKGERSEDISKMMSGFMINPNRNYSGKDVHFENEIERLVKDFQVNPGAAIQAETKWPKLKKAWDYLERLGRVSELTGKTAGYKYLKNETDLSQAEIGHIVRTRIGTPDAKRQGALHQLTNNIFMFSNIGKEGIRSTVESFNANRGAYVWKTMMINVLPKLALVGAAAFGPEWLKQTINKIPEYDKQMYDVVPLGTNREGKAVYLRIPQDYEGQLWGAIAWALAGGRFIGPRGVMDVVGEQSPYSLNPILKVSGDLYKYYIKGQNPTDDFRGQPVIPEKAFTAGGLEASKYMLKHAWSNVGLNAVYTPGSYSERSTTTMEGLLKLPGLNVLGAFLKISDKGELERYYEDEAAERRENAKRLLKIENRVIKSVKSKGGIPTTPDIIKTFQEVKKAGLLKKGTTFPEFKNQYFRYASKAVSDSDLKVILKANKEDRRKLLLRFKESKPAQKYQEIVDSLRKMGVKF
jgi:DNA-binding phage protein